MPKVIITGVAGFVMSNVAKMFHQIGWQVHGVDNLKFGAMENIPEGISFDIMDFDKIGRNFLNEFDVLVHGATSNIIYAMEDNVGTMRNNGVNTIKLFQKFKGRIIYTSTASVYNNAAILPTPEDAKVDITNAYDGSKLLAELYLQDRGNYTTLRLSNVYGINQRPSNPYCGVMARFIDDAMHDRPIKIIGDGNQSRDMTYIRDVEDAILCVKDKSYDTEINIASGKEIQIKMLAAMVFAAFDKEPKIEFIEKRMIDNIDRRCLDISKAKKLLKWSPQVDLMEGIQFTIDWMRQEK